MAAFVLRCQGCGEQFVAKRSHTRWHSDACRKATTRAAAAHGDAFEHIELVVAEIAAGRLTPEDGLLWVVRPKIARTWRAYQVESAAV